MKPYRGFGRPRGWTIAPETLALRREIGGRLTWLRREYRRTHGASLAAAAAIKDRLWTGYARDGRAMPVEAALRVLIATGADPRWLLTGEGRPYEGRSLPCPATGQVAADGKVPADGRLTPPGGQGSLSPPQAPADR